MALARLTLIHDEIQAPPRSAGGEEGSSASSFTAGWKDQSHLYFCVGTCPESWTLAVVSVVCPTARLVPGCLSGRLFTNLCPSSG